MIIINLISQISDLHCHVLQHKSLMSPHKAKHQPVSTTDQTRQAPRKVDPGHEDVSFRVSRSRPRAGNCGVASESAFVSFHRLHGNGSQRRGKAEEGLQYVPSSRKSLSSCSNPLLLRAMMVYNTRLLAVRHFHSKCSNKTKQPKGGGGRRSNRRRIKPTNHSPNPLPSWRHVEMHRPTIPNHQIACLSTNLDLLTSTLLEPIYLALGKAMPIIRHRSPLTLLIRTMRLKKFIIQQMTSSQYNQATVFGSVGR